MLVNGDSRKKYVCEIYGESINRSKVREKKKQRVEKYKAKKQFRIRKLFYKKKKSQKTASNFYQTVDFISRYIKFFLGMNRFLRADV